MARAYINSLGAKGIGEIGIGGTTAAIANVVYNAMCRARSSWPLKASMNL
jgi:CO/xanthine dehydrogenase Mo-binding subunit